MTETSLNRYVDLLCDANQRFIDTVREEEESMVGHLGDEIPPMRDIKQTLAERVRLILEILDYFANKGRQPYARIMEHCQEILTEIRAVQKARSTRSKIAVQTAEGISA